MEIKERRMVLILFLSLFLLCFVAGKIKVLVEQQKKERKGFKVKKVAVEDYMYVQFHVRELYAKLFSLETANNYWKKCLCEFTLAMLTERMDEVDVQKELEQKCLQTEYDVVSQYSEKYKNETMATVDLALVQKFRDEIMASAQVPDGYPQAYVNYFARINLEMKFSHYCPMEWYTDYDGFLPFVEQMGQDEYVKKIEAFHFLWVSLKQ